MNDNLYNKITITIVLYKEKLDLVFSCLENIKNFKVIIVDNAGSGIEPLVWRKICDRLQFLEINKSV